MMHMDYVNAEGLVLGRVASYVATLLLDGKEVIIVNADKAIITGRKKDIILHYKKERKLVHKRKGPYYPKRPDRIFKRTVRGMLPSKKARGKNALKRLKVYVGEPESVLPKNVKYTEMPKSAKRRPARFVELGEVSRMIGGKF